MSDAPHPTVAYFCMEYGLDDRLKTYAGGLGILAGDHLKGAHDLDLPIVGLGIKWKQGYVRQAVDDDGQPLDVFKNEPYQRLIDDGLLTDTGITVEVTIKGNDVPVKVWKCQGFGNNAVYLLDADIEGSPEAATTRWLYGGYGEDRVAQEIVLGVGGVRALRQLGITPDVYHFNEGHALLAAFELVREKVEGGMSKDEAIAQTKEQVVFTTHTPVKAGNETHPVERLTYVGAGLGVLSADDLRDLGGEPFNMTVGALKMCRAANAVAQLHGETANEMWSEVEGRPYIHPITNGIHRPTWVDDAILDAVDADDDDALWAAHQANKRALLDHVERRAGVTMQEDALLVGFARRAVAYKRALLVFSDLDRIAPYLEDGRLQLVFSGKSHPLDDEGKAIVAGLVAMQERFPGAVAFIPDYDMATGAAMTRGSDVWLNNPRRPKEASGTSGMKAAMNGVLNVSILDGWWPEACDDGINGWEIGGAFTSSDPAEQDAHDLASLYDVLLGKVLPTYDDRARWLAMMKASVQSTREAFSVERMLGEYESKLYRTA